MVGQKAADQVRAARRRARARRLRRGRDRERRGARGIAPWDRGAVALAAPHRRGEGPGAARRRRPRRSRAHRAGERGYLNEAATRARRASSTRRRSPPTTASLELDPDNAAAQIGKTGAIGAKSQADAAASGGARAGRRPVQELRRRQDRGEGHASRAGLVGFEDSAGVDGQEGHAGGRAARQDRVRGDARRRRRPASAFKVSVFLSNEGTQPIQLAAMTVATIRRRQAPEGAGSPLGHDRGARPARPRLPDAAATRSGRRARSPGRWRSSSRTARARRTNATGSTLTWK